MQRLTKCVVSGGAKQYETIGWFYLYFPRIGRILRAMFRWFGVSFATHRAIRYVYTRIYSNAFSISRIALTDREASLNTAIISPPPLSLSPLTIGKNRCVYCRPCSNFYAFFPSSTGGGRNVENKRGEWALWFERRVVIKAFSIDLRSHKV